MTDELRALLIALADWLYSITSTDTDADSGFDAGTGMGGG